MDPDQAAKALMVPPSMLGTPPPDYDMAGALAAGLKPDANGHMPDTYKLPNHITFSNESVYNNKNGAQGGQWALLPYGETKQHWMFTPGSTNLQNYTPQQLGRYFQEQEPDSLLKLPNAGITGQ